MNKFAYLFLILIIGNCFAGTSFATRGIPVSWLYQRTVTNERVTQNEVKSNKAGEACAESYLGWFVIGDASVDTAMKQAGLTKIATVEQRFKQYLQFYAEYCIIVKGE
ncbi:MAG: TRL-like family protein [Leptospiraceae bacterium]|nr:TRL-like family protein [Leptospiraceae bacterium]